MDQAVRSPRHESYKDSGLAWLGQIPSHWGLKKSKYLWREKEGRSALGIESLLSVSQYSGVSPRSTESRSESLVGYKLCKRGDLVVNIMLAWQGGLGVTEHSGVVSPSYAVYKQLENHNARYLNYLYRTPVYLAEFARRSQGVVPSRWRMYSEDFGQVLTLLPPADEQERIANFLDEKTAEIDQAITKKRRLIELLKEQKAILINRAVTKGLSPDVAMRDSGVDWIGEVPMHWKLKKLKFYSEVQNGITLGKAYVGKNLRETPYLRVANVQDGYLALDEIAYLELPERITEQYLVQTGDILVTEGGDIDKLGRGTVWNGEVENCIHQNHIFAIRVDQETVKPSFASLAFSAEYGRNYFTRTANKTTNLASTNSKKLGNFPMLVPPQLDEQSRIVDYCGDVASQFADAIDAVGREITCLLELKQTVVSNAVTGKIIL